MKAQFFFHLFNHDKAKMLADENVRWVEAEVKAGTGLRELLEAGIAAGMSKGSPQSGCFEIQTDEGIWSRTDGRQISLWYGKATFRTWAQVEAEEEKA